MDKLAKLRTLVLEEKEIDWMFSHKTHEVCDQQSYSRGMWDDNASRYLWSRFAIPFETDTAKILPEKTRLIEKSQEMIDKSQKLFDNCIDVQSISEDISERLKVAEKEQDSSAHSLSDSQKFYEKAEFLAPQVEKSMESLNVDQQHFQGLLDRRRRVY